MGNIDAAPDLGFANESVEPMWSMLQADDPYDFVIATGISYTVRDFLQIAVDHARLEWEKPFRFGERCLRPTEVDCFIGDASEASATLGWKPETLIPELARLMVEPARRCWLRDGPRRHHGSGGDDL